MSFVESHQNKRPQVVGGTLTDVILQDFVSGRLQKTLTLARDDFKQLTQDTFRERRQVGDVINVRRHGVRVRTVVNQPWLDRRKVALVNRRVDAVPDDELDRE